MDRTKNQFKSRGSSKIKTENLDFFKKLPLFANYLVDILFWRGDITSSLLPTPIPCAHACSWGKMTSGESKAEG
jgi:hypothetical protein